MGKPNVYWAGTPNYTPGNYGIVALFPHWTCGGFDGSVSTLQNPARQASAHYVIEGTKCAQLVDENDSAWHCGNYYYNMRAISYEMVGWPGNPPSRETLDSTAWLMAEASRRYFGGAKLVLGENVMLHRWVYATSCPGESDIDYLVRKANEYLNGGSEEQVISINNRGGKMYRLKNPSPKGFHHFTMSAEERDGLKAQGWVDEGVAFEVSRGNVYPVWRVYNENNGDHYFTPNEGEARSIETAGWKVESVPFFAKDAGEGTPVYSMYNPYSGEHFMTANAKERDDLVAAGWNHQGGFTV